MRKKDLSFASYLNCAATSSNKKKVVRQVKARLNFSTQFGWLL
jgi:hypothetical protein